MPAVARIGDLSTGHGCFPPSPMKTTLVKKTYINGKLPGVVDPECQFESHTCVLITHSQAERYPTNGTSKTKIEGYYIARIADDLACGDVIGQGSFNTFIE